MIWVSYALKYPIPIFERQQTVNIIVKIVVKIFYIPSSFRFQSFLTHKEGMISQSSYFVVNENKKNIEFRFSNTIDKDDEVDIKQVMERFYHSPSQKKEGSGVGLSIAKETIDFHKGKIKIEKNENTLFFILSFHK